MHGAPVRKVAGQCPPLAARAQQIQHCTPHLVQVNGARLGLLARTLQHRFDDFELLAARIAWIFLGSHHVIVSGQTKIVNTFLGRQLEGLGLTEA